MRADVVHPEQVMPEEKKRKKRKQEKETARQRIEEDRADISVSRTQSASMPIVTYGIWQKARR